MTVPASHPLQSIVDAGYAPSVRWLATAIKQGRVPGRMIGRYWRTWRMTDDDVQAFLAAAHPPANSTAATAGDAPVAPAAAITAGLTARGARRLRTAS